jgi:hypothetical protein
LTTILSAFDAVLEFASVTVTVKLLVPVAEGVPEITPVLAVSDKPAGKDPELIDHVKGDVPPLFARVAV